MLQIMEVVIGWFGKASGTMENMKYNIGVYELFVGYFPLHVYYIWLQSCCCVWVTWFSIALFLQINQLMCAINQ